jgi:hypothetical protein
MRRTTARAVLLLLLSAASASPASAQADPCACSGKPRAYVFIGDTDGQGKYDDNAAAEAESDFEKAGYEVITNTSATKQDFKDALKDPCARAIWFVGHGGGKSNDAGSELLVFTDDWIAGESVEANPCLKSVTFHACAQNQQSWKDKFPNAKFYSWTGNTTGLFYFYWQLFHTECAIEQQAALASGFVAGDCLAPPPLLEPRFDFGDWEYDPASDQYFCANEGRVGLGLTLCRELANPLETLRLNLHAVDVERRSFVFHAQIVGGELAGAQETEQPADVAVHIPEVTFLNLLESPTQYGEAVSDGSIMAQPLTEFGSREAGRLLDALGHLLFGELPETCPTQVERETWGRLKARYR